MQRIVAVVFLLGSAACLTSRSLSDPNTRPDAGVPEKSAAEKAVDTFDENVEAFYRAREQHVFEAWRDGGIPQLAMLPEVLMQQEAQARDAGFAAGLLGARTKILSTFVQAQWVSEQVRPQVAALHELEDSLTFQVDGLEFGWRDTWKLLANERSAMKRKALWNASSKPTKQVAEAFTRVRAANEAALHQLQISSEIQFASEARGFDPEQLAREAVSLLESTDVEWNQVLTRLSKVEMNLPNSALTRADLPRLFRVPAALDAQFKRDNVMNNLNALILRAPIQILKAEGRANPLPLLSLSQKNRVILSLKPNGGLLEMQRALALVGEAFALSTAPSKHFSLDVLGRTSTLLAFGRIFESRLQDETYLTSLGIDEKSRADIAFFARAHQLLGDRRAAHQFLAKLHGASISLPGVLHLKSLPADDTRFGVDVGDGWRCATTLKSISEAQAIMLREVPSAPPMPAPKTSAAAPNLKSAADSEISDAGTL
jgi:hypothetical protein